MSDSSNVLPFLQYGKKRLRSIIVPILKLCHVNLGGASYIALFSPLRDKRSRSVLICGIILALAAGAPLPIIGVIFARIIDSFPPSEDEIQARVSQLLAVAVVYFIVTCLYNFCFGLVGARVSRGMRIAMVDRALGLDQTYYETQCPDITSRLTVDAQTVQTGTSEKVGLFIQSISYFIAAFIVGFSLNAQLTGILFAVVIPSMALVIGSGTIILNRFSAQAAEHTTSAAAIAEGAIKAVSVVQAFDAFEPLTADHETYLSKAMHFGIKKSISGAVLLGSVFFIAFAANALAFWQGSRILRSNSSAGGAGTVYAIVFLILDASFVIGQAGPFIQSFAQAAQAGRRILSLVDHPERPINIYSDAGIVAEKHLFEPGHTISLKDVEFKYPAREGEKVLDNINLEIKVGTSVGIVGASGSGKSTIAALLMRFYDPSSGTISIGNHSWPEYNLATLRRHIALVDQDPGLFSGTILSNILDGCRDASLDTAAMIEKCKQAVKAADAWNFIEKMPDGLDTRLGDPGGTRLSGGQKQRICLARALVGDPPLLVLDEATSALDTISEEAILTSLAKSRSADNRTTVMIAHRLASVRRADNIIVMGKGQILEQGNHNELMARADGTYRQLVEAHDLCSTDEGDGSSSLQTKSASIIPSGNKIGTGGGSEREAESLFSAESQVHVTRGTTNIIYRCLQLSRPRLFSTVIALLGSVVTGGLVLGESVIFGNLVQLLNGSVDPNRVNFFCLMFLIVSLVALFGYSTTGTCWGIVSESLIMRTRALSLRTILRQDMQWFQETGRSTSTLVSVISMDSGQISGLSGIIIGTILSALVSVIGGAILAHIMAWRIAIVLFAASPVVLLAGFLRIRSLAKIEEKNRLAYTESASWATEACSNIRTIAALGTEGATSTRFRLAVDKYREQTFRNTSLGNILLSFALAITYFVYALAYWWGSKQVREGRYTMLQFFVVLPAILFSSQAVGQLFSLAPELGRAKGAASRVFALHDQRPTIDGSGVSPTVGLLETREESEKPRGNITFQNVCLTYRSQPGAPVFKNLNFAIRAGETVALVGRSGAGKTSTIALLERFYDPTSGTILLDGVDIRSVPVSQHRARSSLVAQEPGLFSGSVSFNVGLGARPGHVATREEVIEACKAVGIHDFVNSLPEGYETQCGNNGSQLSGGQKQRVAIARAYIRDPDILLLDEATSALDSHSEAQIQEAIWAASRKRTTIMVAHRLTTVQKADRILVFEHGEIVEEGRHEDLVRGGGIYENMVRAQRAGGR